MLCTIFSMENKKRHKGTVVQEKNVSKNCLIRTPSYSTSAQGNHIHHTHSSSHHDISRVAEDERKLVSSLFIAVVTFIISG